MRTFFEWAKEGPTPGHDDVLNTGITGRRQAIVLDGNGRATWFGYDYQYESETGWHPVGRYFHVGIQKKPHLGFYSTYHDGEHRVIHLGWFFITWGW